MGLIRAAKDAVSGYLADQFREYFYCDSLSNDVLVTKGKNRNKSSRHASDNIISNGSVVAVNEGQCMMIVEQGAIVEVCADPGEFVYDTSSEPSLFYGSLDGALDRSFEAIGNRFAFGGAPGKDQRVYYFNIKEITGNLFGTANPIPFRVVDQNIGLDVDISLRCNGEYSFRITDPLLFYKNVCGNVAGDYLKSNILGQMKAELMSAMQPAFAAISETGVRYSAIPAHTTDLCDTLNEQLRSKWKGLRGIDIVSLSLNSVKASPEDEQMIKDLQKSASFRNPTLAGAAITAAQADAMRMAAGNKNAGPMMAFGALNMAASGGASAQALYEMGENAKMQPASSGKMGWDCTCGKTDNLGKFCMECGKAKPVDAGWTCVCGTVNQGKFCMECGKKRPSGAPLYRCDKCSFEPSDPSNPPKFCPECGDIFDENDKL